MIALALPIAVNFISMLYRSPSGFVEKSDSGDLPIGEKMRIDVKHSGLLGDIIYAIPAMLALLRRARAHKIRLFIPNDKVARNAPGVEHIGGGLMCSQAMFDYVRPLLELQSCFEEVVYIEEAKIPASAIDFDVIRSGAINTGAGNIKDYYFKAFALLSCTPSPWISPGFSGRTCGPFDIVIGRSSRYLNLGVSYDILNEITVHVGFIGTEREFGLFRARHPQMEISYAPTETALDACNLIASAALYIGNQSFFFALAEALQANRLLEVYELVPNVVPSGGKCGQFLTAQGLALLLGDYFDVTVGQELRPENLTSNYVLSV